MWMVVVVVVWLCVVLLILVRILVVVLPVMAVTQSVAMVALRGRPSTVLVRVMPRALGRIFVLAVWRWVANLADAMLVSILMMTIVMSMMMLIVMTIVMLMVMTMVICGDERFLGRQHFDSFVQTSVLIFKRRSKVQILGLPFGGTVATPVPDVHAHEGILGGDGARETSTGPTHIRSECAVVGDIRGCFCSPLARRLTLCEMVAMATVHGLSGVCPLGGCGVGAEGARSTYGRVHCSLVVF